MHIFTRSWMCLSAGLLMLCFNAGIVGAHEAHDARIAHLEHQLEKMPDERSEETLALILSRADLHRRQMNWDAAMLDYLRVAESEPGNNLMMRGIALLHLDQREYEQAIDWSERLLKRDPNDAVAGLLLARALAGAGEYSKASTAYGEALTQLKHIKPEHYMEHAQIVVLSHSDAETTPRAIAILDSGAKSLGHPVSLHDAAYKLEIESGQHEAALRRVENILARNGSLLNWRMRRAELLLELKRPADAALGALCLIERIQQMPAHRRDSQAFQSIKHRSESLLIRSRAMNAITPSSSQFDSSLQC